MLQKDHVHRHIVECGEKNETIAVSIQTVALS